MAQSDFAEEINGFINDLQKKDNRMVNHLDEDGIFMESSDVMTGDKNKKRFLYYQLKTSIKQADRIDIIVSFLMESGVRMILKDLSAALDRGAKVRILTGNYLGITQPSALYLIKKELGNRVDLRFYNNRAKSFHPKSYIFHSGDTGEIYIGSSNISRSALTSGIEWNYRFSSLTDQGNFELFFATFEDLFFHHSTLIDDGELKRYSKNWHKPAVFKDLSKYEDYEEDTVSKTELLFQPRGIQIEALYALEESRAEGALKGLVQAATGVGKTYLAAFDSLKYERVLFVAHREEILIQAANSFCNVRASEDYGFFCSKRKETGKSVIFASVATLGKAEYLNDKYFAPDYFDYIVIDEFHHAVNKQYRRMIDYFVPKFLLGLTATPERLDGKNIYEICDYNVPYEISLKEAINKGILVPFHYYGIFDETDYSSLRFVKGHYNRGELTEIYQTNIRRYDLIYKYYKKYRSKRALGFCCSKEHAKEMAREFCVRNIASVAVYSDADGEFSEERKEAVRQLLKEEIRVIFCVDMFNEGLDIASLDMVMFLRPTESPTVFFQQLGRGLRTDKGKEYLNVLDFIGNYENVEKLPRLLGDLKKEGSLLNSKGEVHKKGFACDDDFYDLEIEYPDGCIVDYDMRLIDLFKKLNKKSLSMKQHIEKEYYRVKELLDGKTPTRVEFFTYMEDGIYDYCIRHAKENPFRQYLDFLHGLNELSEMEEELYSGQGREFILTMEQTEMQKVYKIPILYSIYNKGDIRMEVTKEEVVKAWKEFFDMGTNWKDFTENISYEEYKKITDKEHWNKANRMPIHFLIRSGNGFFIRKKGYAIGLREDMGVDIRNKAFRYHMKDILEYRTIEYYRRRYKANFKMDISKMDISILEIEE